MVKVDGEVDEIFVHDEILMGVELKPGTHEIELQFRPMSVYMGLALFLVGLVYLVYNIRSGPDRKNGG